MNDKSTLMLQAMHPDADAVPPPPSFDGWLSRVRAARAGCSGAGLLIVGIMSLTGGVDWVDAVLRGLVAALVCWFAGWALALWVCSELYLAEVRHARGLWERRENQRKRALRELYEHRLRETQGYAPQDVSGVLGAAGERGAPGSARDGTLREAA